VIDLVTYKQPIALDNNALFEKIVRRRRGGFCYEANGLFAALLRPLWRFAIACTVWGDLFNRPVCGFVRLGTVRE